MHYSASLPKVAAMYTAFQMRKSINDFGASVPLLLPLLTQAAATFDPVDPSFLTRTGVLAGSPVSYDVTATKIGLGPLKPVNGGFDVSSEGTFITHRTTGKRFIVVFQSSRNLTTALTAVSRTVDRPSGCTWPCPSR